MNLRIKIFADAADLASLKEMAADPRVQGFTTNPTLMRKAGVTDYLGFARELLAELGTERPVSLEVVSDELSEMTRQARVLAELGPNVYVKIPISNSTGASTLGVIADLVKEKIHVNVTAIMTAKQVASVVGILAHGPESIISIFAGRIADAGVNPESVFYQARSTILPGQRISLLWASVREPYNIIQAERHGAQIITVPPAILKKMDLFGKDLTEYSLDTVKMFRDDALAAGFDF